MFDDRDSGSWPLIAFVLGGLTGLSLAVLFAPASGTDARRAIASGARERLGAGRKALRRRTAGEMAGAQG